MEFISAEEFLKQPVEVREVFIEWWKPSVGDLYCNLYNGQQDNILVVNNVQLELFKTFSNDIKRYGVILFTEGQLRKLIEDKTGYHLEISAEIGTGRYVADFYKNNKSNRCGRKMIKTLETDLLQAYWEIACEIAKESI